MSDINAAWKKTVLGECVLHEGTLNSLEFEGECPQCGEIYEDYTAYHNAHLVHAYNKDPVVILDAINKLREDGWEIKTSKHYLSINRDDRSISITINQATLNFSDAVMRIVLRTILRNMDIQNDT